MIDLCDALRQVVRDEVMRLLKGHLNLPYYQSEDDDYYSEECDCEGCCCVEDDYDEDNDFNDYDDEVEHNDESAFEEPDVEEDNRRDMTSYPN